MKYYKNRYRFQIQIDVMANDDLTAFKTVKENVKQLTDTHNESIIWGANKPYGSFAHRDLDLYKLENDMSDVNGSDIF